MFNVCIARYNVQMKDIASVDSVLSYDLYHLVQILYVITDGQRERLTIIAIQMISYI